MFVKIYWSVWALVLTAAGTLYVTGNLTTLVGLGFGLFAFGLVFMGMMSVLPSMVHESIAVGPAHDHFARVDGVVAGTSKAMRKIGSDIAVSGTVKMHEPGLH